MYYSVMLKRALTEEDRLLQILPFVVCIPRY